MKKNTKHNFFTFIRKTQKRMKTFEDIVNESLNLKGLQIKKDFE